MTTTRTLQQQSSDRVFSAQRAQHRAWIETVANREGLNLLATDPEHGAARAVEVLTKAAHKLAGLTEPETITRPSGVVVTRWRAETPHAPIDFEETA